MAFTKQQVNEIIRLYNGNWSMKEIAAEFDTYKNAIRRVLVKNGVEIRSRSEAQKLALETGRSKHPTEGRKRSEEEKILISDGMAKHWENMSAEEREKRSQIAKAQWDAMTEEERENLMAMANEAVRESSKNGSKLEKSLKEGLTNAGFIVEYHREGLIPNIKLQIDLFLPELGVAIEVDGPSHFFPVWGYESLQKTIEADAEKSGLLLVNGFIIIRVKHTHKSVSAKLLRDVNSAVLDRVYEIRNKKPPKDKRFIEIEV